MEFILDFILHIDQYMISIVQDYHTWAYAILFIIIFCETGLVVTPFLPGDSLLFVAGAISALPGMPIDIHILVLILFAAAVLGDSCNYMIGHFFGCKLFHNPNSRIFKQSYLDKTHEFYKKYGGKTIILARFVPIVRTFAPFVAGMGKMHYYYFMIYNLIGGAIWVGVFCYAGYFFGDLPFVQENLKLLIIAIIFISILIIKSKRFSCNNRNITSEVRIEAIKNFIHLFINNNGQQIKHLKNNLMYSYL